MPYEPLILRGLLVASLLVCGLIVGNMLTDTALPVALANAGPATPSAGTNCTLPPGGIACPRPAA